MEEHFAVVGCELKCPMVRNVQGFEDHLLLGVAGHVTNIDVVKIIDAAAQLQDAGLPGGALAVVGAGPFPERGEERGLCLEIETMNLQGLSQDHAVVHDPMVGSEKCSSPALSEKMCLCPLFNRLGRMMGNNDGAMSGRKPKKNQRLGSSRQGLKGLNRNIEKDDDNEDELTAESQHGQNEFHTTTKTTHFGHPPSSTTDQQTSASQCAPHAASHKDLAMDTELLERKRKMGPSHTGGGGFKVDRKLEEEFGEEYVTQQVTSNSEKQYGSLIEQSKSSSFQADCSEAVCQIPKCNSITESLAENKLLQEDSVMFDEPKTNQEALSASNSGQKRRMGSVRRPLGGRNIGIQENLSSMTENEMKEEVTDEAKSEEMAQTQDDVARDPSSHTEIGLVFNQSLLAEKVEVKDPDVSAGTETMTQLPVAFPLVDQEKPLHETSSQHRPSILSEKLDLMFGSHAVQSDVQNKVLEEAGCHLSDNSWHVTDTKNDISTSFECRDVNSEEAKEEPLNQKEELFRNHQTSGLSQRQDAQLEELAINDEKLPSVSQHDDSATLDNVCDLSTAQLVVEGSTNLDVPSSNINFAEPKTTSSHEISDAGAELKEEHNVCDVFSVTHDTELKCITEKDEELALYVTGENESMNDKKGSEAFEMTEQGNVMDHNVTPDMDLRENEECVEMSTETPGDDARNVPENVEVKDGREAVNMAIKDAGSNSEGIFSFEDSPTDVSLTPQRPSDKEGHDFGGSVYEECEEEGILFNVKPENLSDGSKKMDATSVLILDLENKLNPEQNRVATEKHTDTNREISQVSDHVFTVIDSGLFLHNVNVVDSGETIPDESPISLVDSSAFDSVGNARDAAIVPLGGDTDLEIQTEHKHVDSSISEVEETDENLRDTGALVKEVEVHEETVENPKITESAIQTSDVNAKALKVFENPENEDSSGACFISDGIHKEKADSKSSPTVQRRKMGSTRRPLKGNNEQRKGRELNDTIEKLDNEGMISVQKEIISLEDEVCVDESTLQNILNGAEEQEMEICVKAVAGHDEESEFTLIQSSYGSDLVSKESTAVSVCNTTEAKTLTNIHEETQDNAGDVERVAVVGDTDLQLETESQNQTDLTSKEENIHYVNVLVREAEVIGESVKVYSNVSAESDVLLQDTLADAKLETFQGSENTEDVSAVTDFNLQAQHEATEISGETDTIPEQSGISIIPADSHRKEANSKSSPVVQRKKMGSTRRPLKGNNGQRKGRELHDENETFKSEMLLDVEKETFGLENEPCPDESTVQNIKDGAEEQEKEMCVKNDAGFVKESESAPIQSPYSSELVSEKSTALSVCNITESQPLTKIQEESCEIIGDGEREAVEGDTDLQIETESQNQASDSTSKAEENIHDVNVLVREAEVIRESVKVDGNVTLESAVLQQDTLADAKLETLQVSENTEDVSAVTDSDLQVQHEATEGAGETDSIPEQSGINIIPGDSHREEANSKSSPVVQRRKMGSTRRPLKGNNGQRKGRELHDENETFNSEIELDVEKETFSLENEPCPDESTIQSIKDEAPVDESESALIQSSYVSDILSEESTALSVCNITESQTLTKIHVESQNIAGYVERVAVKGDTDLQLETESQNRTFVSTSKAEENIQDVNVLVRKAEVIGKSVKVDSNVTLESALHQKDTLADAKLKTLQVSENTEDVSAVTDFDQVHNEATEISGEADSIPEQSGINIIPGDCHREEANSKSSPVVQRKKMGSTRRPLKVNKGQRKERELHDESETFNSEIELDVEKETFSLENEPCPDESTLQNIKDEAEEQEKEMFVKNDAGIVKESESALIQSSYCSELVSKESTALSVCNITESQLLTKIQEESQNNVGDVERVTADGDTDLQLETESLNQACDSTSKTEGPEENIHDVNVLVREAEVIKESVKVDGNVIVESDVLQQDTLADTNLETFQVSENTEDVSAVTNSVLLVQHEATEGAGETDTIPEQSGINIIPRDSHREESKSSPVVQRKKMGSTRRPLKGNKGQRKGKELHDENETFNSEMLLDVEKVTFSLENEPCLDVSILQNIKDGAEEQEKEICVKNDAGLVDECESALIQSSYISELVSEESTALSVCHFTESHTFTKIQEESWEIIGNVEREAADGDTDLKLETESQNQTCHSTSKAEENIHGVNVSAREADVIGKLVKVYGNVTLESDVLQQDTLADAKWETLQVSENTEDVSAVTDCDLLVKHESTEGAGEADSIHEQNGISIIPGDSHREEANSKSNPVVQRRKMGSTRRPLKGNKEQRKGRELHDESETFKSEFLLDVEKETFGLENEPCPDESTLQSMKDEAPVDESESALLQSSYNSDLVSEESTALSVCNITESQILTKIQEESQENADREPVDGDIKPQRKEQDHPYESDTLNSKYMISVETPIFSLDDQPNPDESTLQSSKDGAEAQEIEMFMKNDVGLVEESESDFIQSSYGSDLVSEKSTLLSVCNITESQALTKVYEESQKNAGDVESVAVKGDTDLPLEIKLQNQTFVTTSEAEETEENIHIVNVLVREAEIIGESVNNSQTLKVSENTEDVFAVTDFNLQVQYETTEISGETDSIPEQSGINIIPRDSHREESKSSPVVQRKKMGSTRRPLKGNKGQRKGRELHDENEILNSEIELDVEKETFGLENEPCPDESTLQNIIDKAEEQEKEMCVNTEAGLVEEYESTLIQSSYGSDLVSEESTALSVCNITESQTLTKIQEESQNNVGEVERATVDGDTDLQFKTESQNQTCVSTCKAAGTEENIHDVNVLVREAEVIGESVKVDSNVTLESALHQKDTLADAKLQTLQDFENTEDVSAVTDSDLQVQHEATEGAGEADSIPEQSGINIIPGDCHREEANPKSSPVVQRRKMGSTRRPLKGNKGQRKGKELHDENETFNSEMLLDVEKETFSLENEPCPDESTLQNIKDEAEEQEKEMCVKNDAGFVKESESALIQSSYCSELVSEESTALSVCNITESHPLTKIHEESQNNFRDVERATVDEEANLQLETESQNQTCDSTSKTEENIHDVSVLVREAELIGESVKVDSNVILESDVLQQDTLADAKLETFQVSENSEDVSAVTDCDLQVQHEATEISGETDTIPEQSGISIIPADSHRKEANLKSSPVVQRRKMGSTRRPLKGNNGQRKGKELHDENETFKSEILLDVEKETFSLENEPCPDESTLQNIKDEAPVDESESALIQSSYVSGLVSEEFTALRVCNITESQTLTKTQEESQNNAGDTDLQLETESQNQTFDSTIKAKVTEENIQDVNVLVREAEVIRKSVKVDSNVTLESAVLQNDTFADAKLETMQVSENTEDVSAVTDSDLLMQHEATEISGETDSIPEQSGINIIPGDCHRKEANLKSSPVQRRKMGSTRRPLKGNKGQRKEGELHDENEILNSEIMLNVEKETFGLENEPCPDESTLQNIKDKAEEQEKETCVKNEAGLVEEYESTLIQSSYGSDLVSEESTALSVCNITESQTLTKIQEESQDNVGHVERVAVKGDTDLQLEIESQNQTDSTSKAAGTEENIHDVNVLVRKGEVIEESVKVDSNVTLESALHQKDTLADAKLQTLQDFENTEDVSAVTDSDLLIQHEATKGAGEADSIAEQSGINIIPGDCHREEANSKSSPVVQRRKMGSTRRPLKGNNGQRKGRELHDENETFRSEIMLDVEKETFGLENEPCPDKSTLQNIKDGAEEQEKEMCVKNDVGIVDECESALIQSSYISKLVSEESTALSVCNIIESQPLTKIHEESQNNFGDVERATVDEEANLQSETESQNQTCDSTSKTEENIHDVSVLVREAELIGESVKGDSNVILESDVLQQDTLADAKLETFQVSENTEDVSAVTDCDLQVQHEATEGAGETDSIPEQSGINIIPADSHRQEANLKSSPVVQRRKMGSTRRPLKGNNGQRKGRELHDESETFKSEILLDVEKETFSLENEPCPDESTVQNIKDEAPVDESESALIQSSYVSGLVSEESTALRVCNITESQTLTTTQEESQNNAGDTDLQLETESQNQTFDSTIKAKVTEENIQDVNVLVREAEVIGKSVKVDSNVTLESAVLQNDAFADAKLKTMQVSENTEDVSAVTDSDLLMQHEATEKSGETDSIPEQSGINIIPRDSHRKEANLKSSPVQRRKMGSTRRPLKGNKGQRKGRELHDEKETFNSETMLDVEKETFSLENEPCPDESTLQNIKDGAEEQEKEMCVKNDAGFVKESESALIQSSYGSDLVSEESTALSVCNITESQTLTNIHEESWEIIGDVKSVAVDGETNLQLETESQNQTFDSTCKAEENIHDVNVLVREAEVIGESVTIENKVTLESALLQNNTFANANLETLKVSEKTEDVSADSDLLVHQEAMEEAGETESVPEQSGISVIPRPVVQRRKMGSTRRPLKDNNNVTAESDVLQKDALADAKLEKKNKSENTKSLSAVTDSDLLVQHHGTEGAGETDTIPEQSSISIIPGDPQRNETNLKSSPVVQRRKMGSTRRPLKGNKGQKKGRELHDENETLNSEIMLNVEKETFGLENEPCPDESTLQNIKDKADEQEKEMCVKNDTGLVEESESAFIQSSYGSDLVSEESTALSVCNITESQTLTIVHEESQKNAGDVERVAVKRDRDIQLEIESQNQTFVTTSEAEETEENIHDVNVLIKEAKIIGESVKMDSNVTAKSDVLQKDALADAKLETLKVSENKDVSAVTDSDLLIQHEATEGAGEADSIHEQSGINIIPGDSHREESNLKSSPVVQRRKMGSTRRPLKGNKGQRKGRELHDENETFNSEVLLDVEKETFSLENEPCPDESTLQNIKDEAEEQEKEMCVKNDVGLVEESESAFIQSSYGSDLVSEESTALSFCHIKEAQTLTIIHKQIQNNAGDAERVAVVEDTAHTKDTSETEATVTLKSTTNFALHVPQASPSSNTDAFNVSTNGEEDTSGDMDAILKQSNVNVVHEDIYRGEAHPKLSPVVQKRKMGSTRRPLKGNKEQIKDDHGNQILILENKPNPDEPINTVVSVSGISEAQTLVKFHEESQDNAEVVEKATVGEGTQSQTENKTVDSTASEEEEREKTICEMSVLVREAEFPGDTFVSNKTEESYSFHHASDAKLTKSDNKNEALIETNTIPNQSAFKIPGDSHKEEANSKLSPVVQKRKMGSTRRPLKENKGQGKPREEFNVKNRDNEAGTEEEDTETHSKDQDQNVAQDNMNIKDDDNEERKTTKALDTSVQEQCEQKQISDASQTHADPSQDKPSSHLLEVSERTVDFVRENLASLSQPDLVLSDGLLMTEAQTYLSSEDNIMSDSAIPITEVHGIHLDSNRSKRKMGSTRKRGKRMVKEEEAENTIDAGATNSKETLTPEKAIAESPVHQRLFSSYIINEDHDSKSDVQTELSEQDYPNSTINIEPMRETESSSDVVAEMVSDFALGHDDTDVIPEQIVIPDEPHKDQANLNPVVQKRKMGSTRKTYRGNKGQRKEEESKEINEGMTQDQGTELHLATECKFGEEIQQNQSLVNMANNKEAKKPEDELDEVPLASSISQSTEASSETLSSTDPKSEMLDSKDENDYHDTSEPENSHQISTNATKSLQPESVSIERRRKMGSTRKNIGREGRMQRKRDGYEDTETIDTNLQMSHESETSLSGKTAEEQTTKDYSNQSDDSLLGEIQRVLKTTNQSAANFELIINEPKSNLTECSEIRSLSPSQSLTTPNDPNSPERRRKMGSTRKNPKRQFKAEREDEDKVDQKTETNKEEMERSLVHNFTEDPLNKEYLDVPSAQTSSQQEESDRPVVQESASPSTKRKFGSRRANKGKQGLGRLEASDGMNESEDGDHKPDGSAVEDRQRRDGSMACGTSVSLQPENQPISRNYEVAPKGTGEEHQVKKQDRIPGNRQTINVKNRDSEVVQFNVVMVGNSCVGKTSFIRRFHEGQFTEDYRSTIGVDTFVQTVELPDRTVKLQIWDTAGQERFHSITTQVFHKAEGLLLMYEITCSKSFISIRDWISQARERAQDDVVMMLLGNKNDSVNREVQIQEGADLAREYNIHFMECSAANGANVSESMKTLAELLVQRKSKREEHTTLRREPQQKKSGCC